ncbi:MAG: tyrosine--tRNA ligase [Clostridiales bacterium GWF2_36_10]|nr:MAG: tyrosine--tRNA ligase [Clostridiales bacterium GWF2_36_10]HAN20095.1 tyrosine--tRNA ligase [Clostridiales bacterium]
MNNVFDELKARGMIAQTTNEERIRELLGSESVTFYIGFDPTADSLHVGHFVQLMVMAHMQQAGHHPIALLGGGTAMIGDPTGKTDMRKMMTPEIIEHHIECFKNQMSKLVDFNKVTLVNNADWLMNLNYVEFLREVGVHFSVNQMLSAECFKSRMEKGLSFLEFNYMLMQGYDFYYLNKNHACTMQLGGDDQWANILGGIDLCRKKARREVFGMTFALLTTSEGKKMGKTEKGAVWLDPEKTSPYEFFQYWRNIDDADVIKCMNMLTFVPVEEIKELAKAEGSEINKVKERLAYEVTTLVHSKEEADKALEAALSVFGAGAVSENMPSTELIANDFADNAISVIDLLIKTGLTPSRGEARRLIEQGGVLIDDEKVQNFAAVILITAFDKGFVIIKKGKKTFHKVIFNK